MKNWILLLLILANFRAHPLIAANYPIDNRLALEWAAEDDPKALLSWAKQQLILTRPDQHPRPWVRLLWLKAKLEIAEAETDNLRPLILEAMTVAEREGMQEELLDFKRFLVNLSAEESKDPKATQLAFETLMLEASKIGKKRLEAEAIASYAFYLHDISEATRSLELMLKAMTVLAEDPEATELNRMSMKSDLGQVYYYQRQVSRAQDLFTEIAGFCRNVVLRSFCLINDYNMGRLLVDEAELVTVKRSEVFFQNAIRMAQEIGDSWTIATSYAGLATLYGKTNQYEKAIQQSRKALELFREANNDIGLADSYKKLAWALLGGKHYRESLDAIAEARARFPDSYRKDLNDLDLLSYKVYRALGESERALEFLERHDTQFKTIVQEREKAEYSKLMVNLGLQLEEEKNKVLSRDNEIKNQMLAETARFRIYMLSILVLALIGLGSMALAIFRSREVKSSRSKMQKILNNIEEGILTVNHHLQVESEYSLHLNVLLGTQDKLVGRLALPLLFNKSTINGDEASLIQQSLQAAIGEDEVQWSFIAYHLPHELILPGPNGPRVLALHWQPLLNSHRKTDSILIGLKDVTARRKLEAEVVLERQHSEQRVRVVQELVRADRTRVDSLLQQTRVVSGHFLEIESDAVRTKTLRELHTIKGIARTLGLKELSAASHRLEEFLQKYRESSEDFESARQQFISTLDDYFYIVNQVFGRISDPLARRRNLLDVLQSIVPGATAQLEQAGLRLGGLELVDQLMDWPEDQLGIVEQILIHAVSNAVDHGFVFPKKRGASLNSPALQITARRRDERIELKICDNGAGLDFAKLNELARRLDFRPLSGQSVADVVFLDGSSTAAELSTTSGRGVGLAAVRALCQELGGEVQLEPNPTGMGSQLAISFPASEPAKRRAHL